MPSFPENVVSVEDVLRWRADAHGIYMEPRLIEYAVALVAQTRRPHAYIERGASPRASLALAQLARARARCSKVVRSSCPTTSRANAPAVLRHRIGFDYRIATDHVNPEAVMMDLIAAVPDAVGRRRCGFT